ncbi:HlyD family type I secretion periplasmic adaptor subunit [Sphingomonas sp. SM33]|uniref:Membrane fusion protein (MFP) family protein n=1 Tax=Sphingomonas telluris TaxID=2907998 RepID=A0ABS9VHV0_9SPHN|nr:HlyD family type I secretion periplasmic adaptor subunit [Sphingomonas telluris]MCH8614551.1 HlyD family type I secretion periplasmic adaptor subunit [Sphingomonas telluris]
MNLQLPATVFEEPEQRDDPRGDIRIGVGIVIFFFVVLLGWAALAPLDAGARAVGVIAVSGNRQAVQHREGGIVTAINVREGQHVTAGQVLIELAAPDVQATERALTGDYLTLLAQRSRLVAESRGLRSFNAPAEFASLKPEDREIADQAMELQRAQISTRHGSMTAQQSVLGQRSKQLGEEQTGYSSQIASLQEQQRLLKDELDGMKQIAEKGFASINRIRALERALADLKGQEAAMRASIARAGEGKGETRMQSLSIRSSRLEDVATDLRDTQTRISETLPKLVAVREQLERAKVRAPATGQVVGLSVFTVGGVVAPGEKLMDVVPDNRKLVIQAQVSPQDADDVYVGQKAEVRFSSVHDRTLPLLTGEVRTISADSFTDEKTGRSFFRSEIEVTPAELKQVSGVLGHGQLRPGLPVEVVLSVRKRTALQYLLEPLTMNLWRSLREQ